jgi:hypothetical protein
LTILLVGSIFIYKQNNMEDIAVNVTIELTPEQNTKLIQIENDLRVSREKLLESYINHIEHLYS